MIISEVIKRLEELQESGDMRVYLEVGEDIDCSKCGEAKYISYDGFCKSISIINVNDENVVWLVADKE